jgi:tetratricopeptide (TPR) repeat protein
MATACGDVELQMKVALILGQISFDLGDYRQAITCGQQRLQILPGEPYEPTFLAGARPPIQARFFMVQCCSQVGAFAAGVAYGNEARQIVEVDERPYERVAVDSSVGALYLSQGTLHLAIPLLEQAVAVSQDCNIAVFYPEAAAALARAYAVAGRGADVCAILEKMGALESLRLPVPLHSGEAYLRTGNIEEAHRLAQRALADACHRKMRGWEAWAQWLMGEIARHGNPPDVAQAEMHYQQALALATERGMRPLVAHCHLGLDTLYATTSRHEQARTALAAAITLYCAMDMTFWLPQAEAALAQVGGVATPAALPLAREVAVPSTALRGDGLAFVSGAGGRNLPG